MNKESLLIVGTGALATLFAARLSEAGISVHMLGTWKHGLDALKKQGARIVDANGDERTYRVHATDDPRECEGAGHALVLVKSWQTERAAHQLNDCLAENGLAVTLQNGLGNREILAEVLDNQVLTAKNNRGLQRQETLESGTLSEVRRLRIPVSASTPSRVALGTTTTGATLLGPGLVRAGGEGIISIERNQAVGPLEAALRQAKFNVQVVDDAQSLIWGKLVINAAINPLTALLRVSNGELLTRPAAREVMGALAREAASVAEAERVHLPFSNPVHAAEDVARKTAANHSSMFQDVRRGAPTEIDAICGAVTRRGERHGVATPYNRACWKLVQAAVSIG
ncbi:MAG: 2-dehydropantoate 2-reductase [Chloroflexi bacterium]|nr:2-dehydropantoate 2-reductase [Chloroflexota bacterium]